MSVRLGLIARADNRGLGIQTYELYRHLQPAKTLVVRMGPQRTPYVEHVDRFPDARIADLDSAAWQLPDDAIRWLLDDVDVVLTAETPYDLRVYEWAQQTGVRTVVQANPEFWRHDLERHLPRPDLVLNPSGWRLEHMAGAVHLPHPVARDVLAYRPRDEATRFLHVAGHRTSADRQGTILLLQALRNVRTPVQVVIRTQSRLPGMPFRPRPDAAHVTIEQADLDDYATLYDDADVLIAPRRFGGQSLPVNEALACGMPAIVLDRDPDRTWGGVMTVPARRHRTLRTQGGPVEMAICDPRELARTIDRLARDPHLVQRLSASADRYADTISWDTLLPRYEEVLCNLVANGAPARGVAS